jgi:hypothetical protein
MDPHSRKIDASKAPPRRDRRIARQRAQLLASVVGSLALATGLIWSRPWLRAGEADRAADAGLNIAVADRVIKVHRALQFHAQRLWRKANEPYAPANPAFVTFIRGLGDGDGVRLLANPFGSPVQDRAIPVAQANGALPTAVDRAAGRRQAVPLKPLGRGRRPQDGPYTYLTYGALLYDHDPVSNTYVLYGIGRVGDQAAVVHQVYGP